VSVRLDYLPNLLKNEPPGADEFMPRREKAYQSLFSNSHRIVFCILFALQIGIIWALPHFATQDGPMHLYNAALLRNIQSPEWPGIAQIYQLNQRPVPNWAIEALLAGMFSFFRPAVAEKVLVTGYFALFCAGFVYALSSLRKNAGDFWVLGLMLANNFLLGMGFYNFCYGLALFLLAFGYWMRRRDQILWPHAIALAGFGVTVYFSHIFCFLMVAFFIGVMAICYSLDELTSQTRSPQREWLPLLKRIVVPELALMPCLFMALIFLRGAHGENFPRGSSFWERLSLYRGLFVLVNTRSRLDTLFLVLFALFLAGSICSLGICRIKLRKTIPTDGLLAISAVCTAMYVVMPDSLFGGSFVSERLALFALCAALLWVACQEWNSFHRKVATWAAVLVVSLSLISEVQWRARLSPLFDAFDLASSVIQPGSTVLSVCYCDPLDSAVPVLSIVRPWVLVHAGGLSALPSRSVLLYNYEAIGNTFPIEYQPQANFYEAMPLASFKTLVSNMSRSPQLIDLNDFEHRASKRIDYVLLWGGGDPDDVEASKFPLYQQLRSDYQLAFISPAPGQLQVFRRSDHRTPDARN